MMICSNVCCSKNSCFSVFKLKLLDVFKFKCKTLRCFIFTPPPFIFAFQCAEVFGLNLLQLIQFSFLWFKL